MENKKTKYKEVNNLITSHYNYWFYGLLVAVVSVSCACCKWGFAPIEPLYNISSIDNIIGTLISLYGALLSIIVLGAFVYNSFYKTLYVLQKNIPEYNKIA